MKRTIILTFVALVGAGCSDDFKDGAGSPEDTGRPGGLAYDDDGDGFSEDEGDCDDSDPYIAPDVFEIPYNGVDDDCDPSTSDLDADGDGHDADFTRDGDDCDDQNADIYPSQDEIPYNGVDDDCDPNTSDLDADGDGFDAEEKGGDDCDDTDPNISPGIPEDTTDEIDNNCNGIINERFSPSFVDFYTYVGERSAISVDSAGQVHVAYRDETEQQLVYRRRQANGVWEDMEEVPGVGKSSGEWLDAAIGGADGFHVAYTYSEASFQRLEYIVRDGQGNWGASDIVAEKNDAIIQLFPNQASPQHSEWLGYDVTIALDASNLPSFAYYDAGRMEPVLADYTTFSQTLYVQVDAYFDWGHEYMEGFGLTDGPTGYTPSVAIDSNGMDHVVYWDTSAWDGEYLPAGFGDEAQYSAYTDLDLDKIFFSEEVYQGGSYTSLAIRSDNTPCVASQNSFSGDLQYSCRVDGTWTHEVVDSTGNVGAYADLGFNSKDEPYIAYYDASNADLKIATRTTEGATWEVLTVDWEGSVGKEPTLTVGSNDRVYVSYYDATYEALKVAEGR
ncbi:MAG: putative metal-binding motif-containing protein [Myxococcota bacterium]|nr:putative metal-binding motif-containing protein [Myxococcota bacterium]